jgi:hopanoid biosynthesis associated protein HpnK
MGMDLSAASRLSNQGIVRLIVNADDFGFNAAHNEAVIHAHQEGILTTASLMVNEAGAGEAVRLAHQNPRLGVGLHLTLVCGRSALTPARIPGLVGEQGAFRSQPVAAGCAYFFKRSLRDELEAEISAQFRKFKETGLVLDHVNGHLNIHLHPVVFRILMRQAKSWGIKHLRLVRDPLRTSIKTTRGRWLYRLSHALVFSWLSGWALPKLKAAGIRHTHSVFGLLQNGRVNEDYLLRLLPLLAPGESEIYSHPSTNAAPEELAALTSGKVKKLVSTLNIQCIRYQDI